MVKQNNNLVVCANGHSIPISDSKFCSTCGAALAVQQQPAQAVSPMDQSQSAQPAQPQRGQNRYPQQNLQPIPPAQKPGCSACGGTGEGLDTKTLVCKECRWLRPLAPGYGIECSAFQWAEDGKAMSVLRSISPLNAAAKGISQKVGRRWIESTFNGVLLSEEQMPHIYLRAVHAARILGMSYMPDIYLSGERPWDCMTFGSEKDSFIVLGSALAGNFRKDEILFLLAREMGHCRAGHALWKTVVRFFLGEQGPRKGMLAGGIFSALSPSALIGGAIEMPLLAWARQAEITADRAGLLAIRNEEIARRVLLSWSLKSSFIFGQINVDAWLEQQAMSEDDFSRLSELTTSSTPYITRRLKLLTEFAASADLQRWKGLIDSYTVKAQPQEKAGAQKKQGNKDDIRIKCAACGTPIRVPLKVLAGKKELPVRCPSQKCRKITTLKKGEKTQKPGEKPDPDVDPKPERSMNDGEQ